MTQRSRNGDGTQQITAIGTNASSLLSTNDVSIHHNDSQIECGFGIGSPGSETGDQYHPPITVASESDSVRNGAPSSSSGRASDDYDDNVGGGDSAQTNSNPAQNDGNKDDEKGMSLEELIYGAASFHAIVKPVSITMILAALAVIFINTEETKQQGEAALDKSYQVFSISDGQSAATSLGLSLVNSLIIICVIGGMTFLLVLLYKYRCMKFLMGYMCLASTVLLGFLGGQMFYVAIEKYQLAIDKISYYLTMYNFALVGTVAVFYEKGIPKYINQSYLIATSVIVAWQLSYFNDWMAWALLIMLALYDLFAVLTPCGPLKALVNLMQKDDAPSMPGLLYEARLMEGATRPGRRSANDNNRNGNISEEGGMGNSNENNSASYQNGSGVIGESRPPDESAQPISVTNNNDSTQPPKQQRKKRSTRQINDANNSQSDRTSSQNAGSQEQRVQNNNPSSVLTNDSSFATKTLPLAIAKVYKLPLISSGELSGTIPLESYQTAYLEQQFSEAELRANVEVKFPRGGGRIESILNNKGEPRYVVYNRNGEIKRTLLVNKHGKVMEEIAGEDGDSEPVRDNTIKLGLGDFIFYSVLVSKAAEQGFAPFVACFLSILTGLGGTLVLLAVYHHALPALPISIFLSVVIFVLTIYTMEPWIQDMFRVPYYV